jgi:2-polyprenyl-3-methyl-5-hydroxy-6-metoxy-1,4-benzoquinol methylase
MGSEMTKLDAIDNLAAPTLAAVSKWYGIHPKFAHAVLKAFVGVDYDRNIDDIHKLFERYQPLQIKLEYALSANVRGRDLAKQLSQWGVVLNGPRPKSFLDIGCAYAGFLIHFASLGYDVAGIEIDETFGRLGKLNLEVSGCPADFWMGDFLSDDLIPAERKFDLITCNDVIEHVSEPAVCLQKICRMLKPGGVAYVACPNKLAMLNVRSDAHFQCFGLTLLDYFRARDAYFMYSDTSQYRVSDFYEPEWYVNAARSAGVEAEIVYDSAVPEPDVPAEMAMLYTAFADWARTGSKKLDPLMRHEITRELANYSARMFQAYSQHVAHHSVDQFAKKWIYSPTQLLVRKPSA